MRLEDLTTEQKWAELGKLYETVNASQQKIQILRQAIAEGEQNEELRSTEDGPEAGNS